MSDAPQSRKLLQRVAWRLRWRSLIQASFVTFLVACGLYAAALLTQRLTGLLPDVFHWSSLFVVPGAALLAALAWHRRPALRDAARAVDQASGMKDLYLTLALLDRSAGEYQPLVVQAAEETASRIQPGEVVPLVWRRRYWHALWAPAVLAAGLLFLPQLDPFGRVAQASLLTQRQSRLEQSRKETQLRLAEIKQQAEERDEDSPTETAIDDLKNVFNQMQPAQKRENLRSLMQEQKALGELWRNLAGDKLKNLLKAAPQADQAFGAANPEQLQKWTQELQAGSADGLKKELQELKDQLQQLAKTDDPIQKQELEKQIKERLKDLDKFAQQNLDAQKLSASLQRAMKQLDLAQLDNLSSEALEAALESLDLSQMELEELAQSAQDLKALEDALKTLQLAKKVNDQEKLDGEQCKSGNCKSLKDYESLYRKLLAQAGGECQGEGKCAGCAQCQGNKRGKGRGMGGAGIGEGGEAPEDDSIKTDFQSEVSKSAVTAGKILLSLKGKGMGEAGDARREYRSLVQQVKQGLSEAIQQEQVPPGYHDGIKSYFDALDPADARP